MAHSHVFLGVEHEASERRTWVVIWLCGAMMVGEIIGGLLFGSIALVADGLHMSTHAGALLLAALAYSYARKHAKDDRFSFGTGKIGDLAGFSSAIILAMIAVLIGYEAISRIFAPVPIHFEEAIPIAVLGLVINMTSAWLLSGGGHHHHHGHGHGHEEAEEEAQILTTARGQVRLEIFEDGVPPRFRLRALDLGALDGSAVETIRPDGRRQTFRFESRDGFLESIDEVPEPHAFTASLEVDRQSYPATFAEHDHGHDGSAVDNNMRAAVIHVMADAAVSVLVIVGLLLAHTLGWVWMDPLAGILGACVIASWSYGLIRDTGAILLDMTADRKLARGIKETVESDGDALDDLHLWRLGPGHLAVILEVSTKTNRGPEFYHARLARFPRLSHVTVEVDRAAA